MSKNIELSDIAKLLEINTKDYTTKTGKSDKSYENNIKGIFADINRTHGLNKAQIEYLKAFSEGKGFSRIPLPRSQSDTEFLDAVLLPVNDRFTVANDEFTKIKDFLVSYDGDQHRFVDDIELDEIEDVKGILIRGERLAALTKNMTSEQIDTLRTSALRHS